MRWPPDRAALMSPARLTLPGRGCGTENLASSRSWPGGRRHGTPSTSPRPMPGPHNWSYPWSLSVRVIRNRPRVSPQETAAITRGGRSAPPHGVRFALPLPLVRSAGVAELPVGASLGDPPVVQDHDLIDLVQPVTFMGDEQDST